MSFRNSKPYHIAADSHRFEPESRLVWTFDWILIASLCLLLAFGPLAFGAVQEWAMCALEIGAAVCVILWAGRAARRTPDCSATGITSSRKFCSLRHNSSWEIEGKVPFGALES